MLCPQQPLREFSDVFEWQHELLQQLLLHAQPHQYEKMFKSPGQQQFLLHPPQQLLLFAHLHEQEDLQYELQLQHICVSALF